MTFLDERHVLYVGWVVGIAWKNGLNAEPVRDEAGNYTDRITIRFDQDSGGITVVTVVVPPPPDSWKILSPQAKRRTCYCEAGDPAGHVHLLSGPPHEPGCLGNHRGDCAVSGYFGEDREAFHADQMAGMSEWVGKEKARADKAEAELTARETGEETAP